MEDQAKTRERADLQYRLQSSDQAIRGAAVEEFLLKRFGSVGVASLALLASIDPDDAQREVIAGWFEDCGPPDAGDVARLLPFLASADQDVVYWAITLLGRLGSDARAAVSPLVAMLGESVPLAARERAAWALGRIGREAGEARSALHSLAAGKSPRLARLAAEALKEMG